MNELEIKRVPFMGTELMAARDADGQIWMEYEGASQMEWLDQHVSFKCKCPTCGNMVYQ